MHKIKLINLLQKTLLATLLAPVLVCTSNAHVIEGVSFFSPRSQSTNYARDIAGINRYRIQTEDKPAQSYINITPYYSHSVRSKKIADSLFGTNTLTITGSMVENRTYENILADYFGLSPTFESVVTVEPHIQNALLFVYGHYALDKWAPGLYFDIIVPMGWTQWRMELEEQILNTGSDTSFPAHYMAPEEISAPITGFVDALNGTVRFGQMQDPVHYGKISSCPLSQKGASDIIMALGWNCIQKDYGHFGINTRLSLPTGNRPTSQFFFEPILGNGKHVELGIGFDGHIVVWEKDGTQEVSLYGGANITHLFKTRQQRSFDLKNSTLNRCGFFDPYHNGALSRYMLLKQFDQQGNYNDKLTPVINHTTFPCTVHVDLKIDMVLMFEYTHDAYLWDIGYNGFIRSKEKICLKQGIPSGTFGLKGIQNVSTDLDKPSNSTQSGATIFGNKLNQQAYVADQNPPLFISTHDVNIESAACPRLITHKLFTHIGYTWYTNSHYEPFVGIGAELEFEGINPRNRTQPVHDTLSVWGIWFKGGFAL